MKQKSILILAFVLMAAVLLTASRNVSDHFSASKSPAKVCDNSANLSPETNSDQYYFGSINYSQFVEESWTSGPEAEVPLSPDCSLPVCENNKKLEVRFKPVSFTGTMLAMDLLSANSLAGNYNLYSPLFVSCQSGRVNKLFSLRI